MSKPKCPPPLQYFLFNIEYSIFNQPMTDILSRLTAALAERYEIKHELGAGAGS